MGDLYHIPHDNGIDFRLKKFVEYQHEVPSIHYRFLGEFIKQENIKKNRLIWLDWLLCNTYNEITCVLLNNMINYPLEFNYGKFWVENKSKLIFGSAKMWVKRKDLLPSLMKEFNKITKGKYYDWFILSLSNSPTKSYQNIYKNIVSIYQSSRLSADFFLELLVYLQDYIGIELKEPAGTIDWKKGANLTSGLLNIFYEDEKANEFDNTGKIHDVNFLNEAIKIVQAEIKKTYPEQNAEIPQFIGKICSFRNLFKGARYAGFHHDRQLEWIRKYEEIYPEYKTLWKTCYRIRKEIFPHKWLGELNGWNGIRKERKKLWLKYGLTGAEINE